MESPLINSSFRAFTFGFPNRSYISLNPNSFSPFRFKNCNTKFKTPSFAVSCLKPQNPFSDWDSPIKPVSFLAPILKKVTSFASKASNNKWASAFLGYNSSKSVQDEPLLQNGAFGMALLSVTSTAKVKISPVVAVLAANPTFVSGLMALLVAQWTKFLLNFFVERRWDFRIVFSCGGMPSSHSALCTALTTSVAICHGLADSLFPVCLGFSLIVMYDAIGVRRHAGLQAEVLNVIIEDLFQGHPISQRKLKELLGHTLSQVLAGAVLGVMVAWICCQGCL